MKRYYFLLLISLALISWSVFVNSQTMTVLYHSATSVFAGYGMKEFMEPVIGLLANGTITVVEPVYVKLVLVIGFILSYVSLFKIVNRNNKNKLRDIFSIAYWRHIDVSFVYKPVKVVKK